MFIKYFGVPFSAADNPLTDRRRGSLSSNTAMQLFPNASSISQSVKDATGVIGPISSKKINTNERNFELNLGPNVFFNFLWPVPLKTADS